MPSIVLLHNHFFQDHLEKVVEEMKTLGAPTIRVYDLGMTQGGTGLEMVQAIEGCHRLRACEILSIEPVLEYVDPLAKFEDLDLDWDGAEVETVGELGDWENYSVDFED